MQKEHVHRPPFVNSFSVTSCAFFSGNERPSIRMDDPGWEDGGGAMAGYSGETGYSRRC